MEKKKKTFHPTNKCCRKHCHKIFGIPVQERIFKDFAALTSFPQRTKFLRSIIKVGEQSDNGRRGPHQGRSKKSQYFLNGDDDNEHRVCVWLVLGILQTTRGALHRAGKSITTNPTAEERRGKFSLNKLQHEQEQFIRDFIMRVPLYEATRNASRSKYKFLHPRLSYKIMYEAFRKHCIADDMPLPSYHAFTRVLHKVFKYVRREQKRRYICRTCYRKVRGKTKSPEDGQTLMDANSEHEADHEAKIEYARQGFQSCVRSAKKRITAVLSIELQRALEMPYLSDIESFDWHQLWFSNLCITDEVRGKTYMYTWDESIARRGSEEIISCLYRHLFNVIQPTVQKIILYSDPSDIYRNMTVTLMLKKIFDYWPHEQLRTIEQRFFEYGHNFGKSRRTIALIEKSRRRRSFFGPADWVNVLQWATRRNKDMIISEMASNQFYSAGSLLPLIVDQHYTADNQKIFWQSMKSIKYKRREPFRLCFKTETDKFVYDLSDQDPAEFHKAKLAFSSLKGNAITRTKYEQLQNLLIHMPANYHEFYRNLRFKNNNNIEDYALILDNEVSSGDEEICSDDNFE